MKISFIVLILVRNQWRSDGGGGGGGGGGGMSPGAGLRGCRNRREIINYRVNDERMGRYRGARGGL